jgi:hypothetical protein
VFRNIRVQAQTFWRAFLQLSSSFCPRRQSSVAGDGSVTDAKALPGYRLWVRFSASSEGEVQPKDFVFADARPIVVALREPAAFNAIRVDMDTVVWANGFDLAPAAA